MAPAPCMPALRAWRQRTSGVDCSTHEKIVTIVAQLSCTIKLITCVPTSTSDALVYVALDNASQLTSSSVWTAIPCWYTLQGLTKCLCNVGALDHCRGVTDLGLAHQSMLGWYTLILQICRDHTVVLVNAELPGPAGDFLSWPRHYRRIANL